MMELLARLSLVFLAIPSLIGAIEITDLFTLKPGTTNGGCDAHTTDLDNYLEEAIFSIDAAERAISLYQNPTAAQAADAMRVRMALYTWFKIPMTGTPTGLKIVQNNLAAMANWLNGNSQQNFPPASTFLYCDCTWLTQEQPSTTAVDFNGNPVVVNDENVPISSVPSFDSSVSQGLTIWYSGDNTNVPGYYFTKATGGGNYCSNVKNLGLTSNLRQLRISAAGKPVNKINTNVNVILCPQSFTAANKPTSYDAGRTAITAGSTLEAAVPRSSTLLHEGFHVVNGGGTTGFNEGDEGGMQEYYGQAICLKLADKNAPSAKKNPENYVFFISAMYYLFGDTLESSSGNGIQFWDFTNGPDNARGPIARP